jgi:hypothetical protein
MRRSPAEFARVKVRFPQWYIQRTLPGAAVPCGVPEVGHHSVTCGYRCGGAVEHDDQPCRCACCT